MMRSLFSAVSGLKTHQTRMDVIGNNIANVNTTRAKDGKPYKRKTVLFEEKSYPSFSESLSMANRHNIGKGVKASKIVEDNSEGSKVYDPSHPDADENGYVTYPNVNIVTEMTDLIDASRSYEANSTAFNASKSMALKGLEIGQ